MIATARLDLAPWTAADVDVLLAMLRTPHVRRFLLDDELVERAWVEAEVRASRARFQAGGCGLFLARERAGRETIGFAGFRPFYDPPVVQLLYAVRPESTRKGYAIEMATALAAHAFERLGWDVVRASTDEPNGASIRVLERIGMTPAGRTRGGRWEQLHFELRRPATAARGAGSADRSPPR